MKICNIRVILTFVLLINMYILPYTVLYQPLPLT